jgi:hypothetical protein
MAINQLGGGSAALEAKFNAKGDILVATANDVSATNVSVGTNGQILVADSSQAAGVVWAANAPDVATTKGDLITRTASGYARIGVGSNGQGLLADSSTSTGLVWGAPASVAYYDKISGIYIIRNMDRTNGSKHQLDVLCNWRRWRRRRRSYESAQVLSATPGGGGAGGNAVYIKHVPVTPGVNIHSCNCRQLVDAGGSRTKRIPVKHLTQHKQQDQDWIKWWRHIIWIS